MSGNKYTRAVSALEADLNEKLAQLKILEEENVRLKRQDHALTTFIGSVEGGVSVKTAILKAACSEDSAGEGDRVDSPASTRSTGSVAQGPASTTALLDEIEAKERQIQSVLRQLGSGPYDNLYSTWLLRKGAQTVMPFLQSDTAARRAEWSDTVRHLALLLPKYDFPDFPDSQSGTVKQRVDSLVDESASRVLIAGLLDPPGMQLYDLMVNFETNRVESYPKDWWHNVIKNLDLSDDQKSSVCISWQRVKANKLALGSQHQQLIKRLRQLQTRNKQGFKHFEQQAQVLHTMLDPHVGEVQALQAQLQQQRKQHQGQEGQPQQLLLQQQREEQQALRQEEQLQQLQVLAQARQMQQKQLQQMQQTQQQQMQQKQLQLQAQQQQMQQTQQQEYEDMQQLKHQMEADGDPFCQMSCSELAAMAMSALAHDVTGTSAEEGEAAMHRSPGRQQQQQPLQLHVPAAAQQQQLLEEQQQQELCSPHHVGCSCCPTPAPADDLLANLSTDDFLSSPLESPASAGSPRFAAALEHEEQQLLADLAPAAARSQPLPMLQAPASPALQQQQQQQPLSSPLPRLVLQQQQPFSSPLLPAPASQQQQPLSSPLLPQPELQQQQAFSSPLPSPVSQQQQQQQQLQRQQSEPPGPASEHEEVLLNIGCKEQRQLECELDRISAAIKLQHYCQSLHLVNTLTKKQLAQVYVLSWPYMPDAFMMCEALEAGTAAAAGGVEPKVEP